MNFEMAGSVERMSLGWKPFPFRLVLISYLTLLSLLPAIAYSQFSYPAKTKAHVAVFLVDFPETPVELRAEFPKVEEWEKILFDGKIKEYLDVMTYNRFQFTGDVYEYSRSPVTLWESGGSPKNATEILKSLNVTALGFDPKNYDELVFLLCYDAREGGSQAGLHEFRVNGQLYSEGSIVVFYMKGRHNRDINYSLVDGLTSKIQYLIPISANKTEEGDVWENISKFERTFLHELIHGLGIGAHAKSRTNNGRADWEPRAPNNQEFWDQDYGNNYDVMGRSQFGMSLNGGFRDILGWMDTSMIASISTYGTRRVTINHINSTVGKRYIEVLMPGQINPYGDYKNDGYGLEYRNAGHWDTTMNHPQLSGNTEGLFVMKVAGLSNFLLDMSPSPNLSFSWGVMDDLRDVVLKPGMSYENNEVRLDNVVKNSDGSISVDIQIKSNVGTDRGIKILDNTNPSFHSVYSSFIPIPENLDVEILDIKGKTLERRTQFQGELHIEDLPPGIYRLRIKRNGNYKEHLFFKSK